MHAAVSSAYVWDTPPVYFSSFPWLIFWVFYLPHSFSGTVTHTWGTLKPFCLLHFCAAYLIRTEQEGAVWVRDSQPGWLQAGQRITQQNSAFPSVGVACHPSKELAPKINTSMMLVLQCWGMFKKPWMPTARQRISIAAIHQTAPSMRSWTTFQHFPRVEKHSHAWHGESP